MADTDGEEEVKEDKSSEERKDSEGSKEEVEELKWGDTLKDSSKQIPELGKVLNQ